MQRPPERKRLGIGLHGRHIFPLPGTDDQILATENAKTVFLREANLTARLRTTPAEDAAAHIETRLFVCKSERVRNRTHGLHRLHVFRRRIRGDLRPASEIGRQVRRGRRKRPGPAPFLESCHKRLEHIRAFLICRYRSTRG